MNWLIRLFIIAIAGYASWELSGAFSLAAEILVKPRESRWFNVLTALHELVLGPALVIAAIVLAITNKRLVLAASLVGTALVIYFIPFLVFFISIMIYGF